MPAKKEISLLPDEENLNTLSARVLRYLTTIGRVIIILTELAVISAFLSRFWLDRKNADLSETIRQQKAILESTQEFEKEYAVLQQKLVTIKNLTSAKIDFHYYVNTLVKSTPADILYQRFDITHDTGTIINGTVTITAYSEKSLVDFLTNLMLNPDIKTVDIGNIEKKIRDNKYTLTLNITFNTKKT